MFHAQAGPGSSLFPSRRLPGVRRRFRGQVLDMTLTFKARSPEDILAVVPVVLGFEPEESVVMLTFGGRHSFHARADLPGLADISSCAEQLLRPALSHGDKRGVRCLRRTRASRATHRPQPAP